MKKSTVGVIPEKIHILNIQLFKASLETTDEVLDSGVKTNGFNVDIGHEMAHNLVDKMVRLRMYLSIRGLDESQKKMVGLDVSYGIEFHFNVENLDDLIEVTKDGIQTMRGDIAATLFGMAYSTARGIILTRTQGTLLGGVILPVVDPIKVLGVK